MESTRQGVVIRTDLQWSDMGSWTELHSADAKDAAGNVTHGDVVLRNVTNSYVRADGRLIAAVNVSNVAIVETSDAILVANLSEAEKVKELVQSIEQHGRGEHLSHRRVHRPWGYYEALDSGQGFQVKRLMVKPGHSLSLQRHRQRAEHWVVVSGQARVTRDRDVFELYANQSTYIPIAAKHRLENPGQGPLFVIEVQSGSYLGEDDIERFEDRYNRN
jgi:mannose-1-phosphate guanylyltransferase / mannose-6-phosphate isomerase